MSNRVTLVHNDMRIVRAWLALQKKLENLAGDGKVFASAGDTVTDFLTPKLVGGTNVTLTILNPGGNEQIRIDAAGGVSDGKSFVTGADTTRDFLQPKIVAGARVTLNVLNPAGNEQLEVVADVQTGDRQSLVTGADTTAGFLGVKFAAGANISFNVLNPGANEQLEVVGATQVGDRRLQVTAADTTPDFLNPKMSAGTGISFNVLNPGANEQLEIVNTVAGLPAGVVNQHLEYNGSWTAVDSLQLPQGAARTIDVAGAPVDTAGDALTISSGQGGDRSAGAQGRDAGDLNITGAAGGASAGAFLGGTGANVIITGGAAGASPVTASGGVVRISGGASQQSAIGGHVWVDGGASASGQDGIVKIGLGGFTPTSKVEIALLPTEGLAFEADTTTSAPNISTWVRGRISLDHNSSVIVGDINFQGANNHDISVVTVAGQPGGNLNLKAASAGAGSTTGGNVSLTSGDGVSAAAGHIQLAASDVGLSEGYVLIGQTDLTTSDLLFWNTAGGAPTKANGPGIRLHSTGNMQYQDSGGAWTDFSSASLPAGTTNQHLEYNGSWGSVDNLTLPGDDDREIIVAAAASGAGKPLEVRAANGSSVGVGGAGGNLNLLGGNADGTGANAGGNVTVNAGSLSGAGANGNAYIGRANTTLVQIGDDTDNWTFTDSSNVLGATGAANINLPNNASARFQIQGAAVSANVTSANLGTLTAGAASDADALHTHPGIGGGATISKEAGESLVAGNVVSIARESTDSNNPKAWKTDVTATPGDDVASPLPAGFVTSAYADGATATIHQGGEVDVVAALWTGGIPAVTDIGKMVYASETAGNVTLTTFSTSGSYLTKVGILSDSDGSTTAKVTVQIGDSILNP